MNNEKTNLIRETIISWKNAKSFIYEDKQVHVYSSPIVDGELVFRFKNTLHNFSCAGDSIQLSLTSQPFHTTTLRVTPIGSNPNADKYRLTSFLEDFDKLFYKEVERKLNDCLDHLTPDSLFFD